MRSNMKRPRMESHLEVNTVAPHPFVRRGWRLRICHHCFAPRSLHPRKDWVTARPLGENEYISASSWVFKVGW